MKKFIIIVLIIVVPLAIYIFKKKYKKVIPKVETVNVVQDTFYSNLDVSGTVQSFNKVKIFSKIAGKVNFFPAKEGSFIYKGQTVATLDASDLYPQLKQAQINLQAAQIKFKQLQNGSRKEEIASTDANKEQAQLRLEQAEKEYNRILKLYEEGAIPYSQLESVKLNFDLAKKQLAQIQEQKKIVENKAQPLDFDLAKTQISQAQTQIQLIQQQISQTRIHSPITGTLIQKFTEAGEVTTPQTPLGIIADLNSLYLEANVDETDLSKIKAGMKANIKLDAYNDEDFYGIISYISNNSLNIQEKGNTFLIKITLYKSKLPLKIGMSGDAEILLHKKENCLLVPIDAVFEENGKKYVFKLSGDIIQKKQVIVADENEEFTQIKNGLNKDEVIVSHFSSDLQDGQKVEVKAIKN